MDKYKLQLTDFLENPTGMIFELHNKKPSLEDLQPIIIFAEGNDDTNAKKLMEELRIRNILFCLNPTPKETPPTGYPIDLRRMELIY